MKLKPEIKNAWVDALRSGKYQQGHFHLIGNDPEKGMCHCAMGVLADTLGYPVKKIGRSFVYQINNYESYFTLPIRTIKEISEDGTYSGFNQEMVRLNDILKWSFNDIAYWIERNL